MGLTLERLNFDPTDAATGPVVGSYILSASGNVIDDTGGALDVSIANASIAVTATDLDIRDLVYTSDSVTAHQGGSWSATVSATDLDIRDLSSAQDSVEIKTAAGQALAIDGSGFITANINGTVTVSASDLDIRDLSHSQDSVKVGDGTEFLAVNADGSINVQFASSVADDAVDSENPIKVGSHAYDQASVWGAVAAGDKANLASDRYRRVLINDAPNVGVACAAVSVIDSEVLLGTASAGRSRILIQNRGTASIFVGPTGVTTSSGLEISKGGTLEVPLGEALDLYGIAASGSHNVRVMQLG